MTALELEVDQEEEINVDGDSRPGSPAPLIPPRPAGTRGPPKPPTAARLSFSISALLGDKDLGSDEDDRRVESDDDDDHEDDHDDEESYEEVADDYHVGYGALGGLPLPYGPLAGGAPTVLRVPAHRPMGMGYPGLAGLAAAHPWLPGLAVSPFDRPTALAPHYPTLDRLAGESRHNTTAHRRHQGPPRGPAAGGLVITTTSLPGGAAKCYPAPSCPPYPYLDNIPNHLTSHPHKATHPHPPFFISLLRHNLHISLPHAAPTTTTRGVVLQ